MIAKVKQVGPTPYRQPHWYAIRIEVGDIELEALSHFAFYDKKKAQKFADKVNKKLKEEQNKVIAYAIELEKESHEYDPL